MIRQANLEDIKKVKTIMDSLYISRKTNIIEPIHNGFFEYTKSIEELNRSINPYFLVIDNNGSIDGFGLCYSSDFFKTIANKYIPEDRFILGLSGEFVYIDMVAESKDKVNESPGIAGLFFEVSKLSKKQNITDYVTLVTEKPTLNKDCEQLLNFLGFNRFSDIYVDPDIVHGAYRLKT